MNVTDESIVKADRHERLRYTTEEKTALVEAYQSSGLSGPRFAELYGVNYATTRPGILAPKTQEDLGHVPELPIRLRPCIAGAR
jgi:hypothetical protein